MKENSLTLASSLFSNHVDIYRSVKLFDTLDTGLCHCANADNSKQGLCWSHGSTRAMMNMYSDANAGDA